MQYLEELTETKAPFSPENETSVLRKLWIDVVDRNMTSMWDLYTQSDEIDEVPASLVPPALRRIPCGHAPKRRRLGRQIKKCLKRVLKKVNNMDF